MDMIFENWKSFWSVGIGFGPRQEVGIHLLLLVIFLFCFLDVVCFHFLLVYSNITIRVLHNISFNALLC